MIRIITGNLDYVLFVASILLGFSLKHLLFRRRWIKTLWASDLLFLAILLPATGYLVHEATQKEHARLKVLLGGVIPTYARETERMGHARITVETAPDDPAYLRLIEAQKRWLELNPSVADIYTLRKRRNGQNVFIVDSETDYNRNGVIDEGREERTPIGEVYEVRDAGLERAWAGTANFDPQPTTDRWGTWVAAWHPLYDADGKVEAVLGVDYDAAEWLHSINHARSNVLVVAGCFALIVGGLTGALALQRAHRRREREAMVALQRSEERLALHLKHTPLAAIEWDLDFQAVQWNPSAERIFGFSAKEAIGKTGFDLIVPQTMHALTREIWRDLTRKGIPRSTFQEGITKAGRAIVCEFFHTPLINPEGNVIGVASLCQDITERRALEEELRQSQKLQSVSSLAAAIAHDFNNLLAVIQGHNDLILERSGLPEGVLESGREINLAVQNAVALSRQLLAFSRKERLILKPLGLLPLLERIARMIRPALGPKIDLRIDSAGALPPILGNGNSLEQAIVNLILNARDAQPTGGAVTVAARLEESVEPRPIPGFHASPGRFVLLSVCDKGMGIPPEYAARIFEPFFTTKPEGQGTGLGLAAVVRIIKDHHGWIELESKVGEGTCFRIFLPVSEKEPPESGEERISS